MFLKSSMAIRFNCVIVRSEEVHVILQVQHYSKSSHKPERGRVTYAKFKKTPAFLLLLLLNVIKKHIVHHSCPYHSRTKTDLCSAGGFVGGAV